jgi:predicted GNAT family acetyltransferase
MADQINVEVSNNLELNRYEARIGSVVAGFAVYRLHEEQVVFTHTVVADEWEGHGVASAPARFALDDVVGSGRQITPLCPFIAGYIAKHPEYVSSVDAAHQAQFQ